jgi:hypothetical protein
VTADLDALLGELDMAAARLRGGKLDGVTAAALVERCAELATEIATELDRRAREAQEVPPAEESPDQERLL